MDFYQRNFEIDPNPDRVIKKEEERWLQTIKKHGKQVLSTIDELLIQEIETGIVDLKKLEEELNKRGNRVDLIRLKKNMLAQIETFRYSLKGEYDEALNSLKEQFLKSKRAIGIDVLNIYIDILEYLGEVKSLDEAIASYFSQNETENENIHREIIRRSLNSLGNDLHPKIKDECMKQLKNTTTRVELNEAIAKLHNYTSPNDAYLLEKIQQASDAEIKDEIKKLDNENFYSVIKDFFDLNDNRGKSDKKDDVKKRVQKLIKEIAKENKRNELVLKNVIGNEEL